MTNIIIQTTVTTSPTHVKDLSIINDDGVLSVKYTVVDTKTLVCTEERTYKLLYQGKDLERTMNEYLLGLRTLLLGGFLIWEV